MQMAPRDHGPHSAFLLLYVEKTNRLAFRVPVTGVISSGCFFPSRFACVATHPENEKGAEAPVWTGGFAPSALRRGRVRSGEARGTRQAIFGGHPFRETFRYLDYAACDSGHPGQNNDDAEHGALPSQQG